MTIDIIPRKIKTGGEMIHVRIVVTLSKVLLCLKTKISFDRKIIIKNITPQKIAINKGRVWCLIMRYGITTRMTIRAIEGTTTSDAFKDQIFFFKDITILFCE